MDYRANYFVDIKKAQELEIDKHTRFHSPYDEKRSLQSSATHKRSVCKKVRFYHWRVECDFLIHCTYLHAQSTMATDEYIGILWGT